MKTTERTLFATLWILIAISVCIWHFWPREQEALTETPRVTLKQDLNTWFTEGRIVKATLSQFHIELSVRPEYLKRLNGEDKRVTLGYRLLRGNSLLIDGRAECRINPSRSLAQLVLENPERMSPNEIVLYLAQ